MGELETELCCDFTTEAEPPREVAEPVRGPIELTEKYLTHVRIPPLSLEELSLLKSSSQSSSSSSSSSFVIGTERGDGLIIGGAGARSNFGLSR